MSVHIPFITPFAGWAKAKFTLLTGKQPFCTIVGGPVSGKKILFNREIHLGDLAGRSDIKVLKTLQKLVLHQVVLKKDAVIINAGAGYGLYELFFAKHLGNRCQLYAFESGTGAQELLEKNLHVNNVQNATMIKKAISGKIGIINFFENPLHGSSLVEEEAQRNKSKAPVAKTVFTTTLDIFCKRYILSPAFIRLNVNGSADQALQGAAETIEKCRPVVFVQPRRKEERAAIVQLMEQQQYEAFSINEFEWVHLENDEEDVTGEALQGPLLLCPYQLKEEVNYAMYNRYRRDAGAVQKWMPRGSSGDYALN